MRSVGRLAVLQLAVPLNGMLAVRECWPLLSHAQRRLPGWLAAEHAQAVLDARNN